jgi:hypothetical protein
MVKEGFEGTKDLILTDPVPYGMIRDRHFRRALRARRIAGPTRLGGHAGSHPYEHPLKAI